jgi:DNA uptake protein ComE-like DNA-binding protein
MAAVIVGALAWGSVTGASNTAAAAASAGAVTAATDENAPAYGKTGSAKTSRNAPVTNPTSKHGKAGPLDINTASIDQLRQLPGIGDVRAAAIVAGRPYQSADDLVTRKIVPASTFKRMQAKVMVSASAAPTTPRSGGSTTTFAKVANGYGSSTAAAAHCPKDLVVWANTESKVYHFAGSANFGTTKTGAFMCERDARDAGLRAALNEKRR